MKTDDLIALLSTNPEPVDRNSVTRTLFLALAAGIAVALVLSACGTSNDVKRTGVVWQGTVAARYDQLAKCLSTQTTLYYKAALQFDGSQRHATVTFLIPVTGIPVEVYDLRQVSNNATEVSWSTRLERGRQEVGKPLGFHAGHLPGMASEYVAWVDVMGCPYQ